MTARKTLRKGPVGSASLRHSPIQARAVDTVEHLVATAASLLAEVGVPGFNTNLLAERAQVTVPTVYRYFPNKLAVIEELASRLMVAWGGWLDDELLADPRQDWRAVWDGYIDAFVAGVAAEPAGLAIRAAIHSLPELREMEALDTERLARRVSRALMRRDPSLDPRRIRVASEVLLTTAIAVLDQAFSGPPRQRAPRLRELKEIHAAYLETLLG